MSEKFDWGEQPPPPPRKAGEKRRETRTELQRVIEANSRMNRLNNELSLIIASGVGLIVLGAAVGSAAGVPGGFLVSMLGVAILTSYPSTHRKYEKAKRDVGVNEGDEDEVELSEDRPKPLLPQEKPLYRFDRMTQAFDHLPMYAQAILIFSILAVLVAGAALFLLILYHVNQPIKPHK